MPLAYKKQIQSSLSPRYKLLLLAFRNLTGKETESNAIREIIEEKFDMMSLPDKLMYKRYIEKHFPEEAGLLQGIE
jgi:hypothetical protein